MKATKTAGGVVVGPAGWILVVNQNGDSWSLPKGHIDLGETARQAAEREIQEESGVLVLNYVQDLGVYERFRIALDGQDDPNELKAIHMFLYTTTQSELKPEDPHNPEARWVAPENVANILTHKKDQAFFEKILPLVMTQVTPRS